LLMHWMMPSGNPLLVARLISTARRKNNGS
jgi:hypothetical protein